MKYRLFSSLTFFACLCSFAYGDVVEDVFTHGVTAALRDPVFSDGVLKTEKGGVITGPDFRIQAQKIVYTKKMNGKKPVYTIEATDDLLMEFGETVFIGEKLFYDFQEKSGVIYNGRSMLEPWFFGGDEIHLCADGSYVVYNGFVTTSESRNMDWQISAGYVSLNNCNDVCAKNIQLKICRFPILWIPSLKGNLDEIFDSPISYYFRWGGRQGPRAGLVYEFFTWNRLKTVLRLDYRLQRGIGGGIETHYRSEDHKTVCDTINYVAQDSSLDRPHEKIRYRFEGVCKTLLLDDKICVKFSYDKLSDKDMASDYNDYSFNLDIAGRTQLLMRRQESRWINNFVTRVRVNNFQTIKQELPSFETSWLPFNLGNTGIISEAYTRASYLDFVYANHVDKYVSNKDDYNPVHRIKAHDYNSTRLEFCPRFYRLYRWKQFNITPQVGAVTILYGNSPRGSPRWLNLGLLSCDVNTQLSRNYKKMRHVITPYLNYKYFTYPTISPNDHYIFDIEDGWYRLNMMRFGVEQSLFYKDHDCNITRLLFFDLHANAFFFTKSIPAVLPKVYSSLVLNSSPRIRHTLEVAWDFEKKTLDHFNFRNQWTFSPDAAISLEYRHRSAYDWRKVDHDNFILDSYRSVSSLRKCDELSDRRDTVLLHLFYRFHPNFALEIQSRNGWNRETQPNYNEFEIKLRTTLRSAWNITASYQRKENDNRLAIYFSLNKKRPNQKDCHPLVPYLDF